MKKKSVILLLPTGLPPLNDRLAVSAQENPMFAEGDQASLKDSLA